MQKHLKILISFIIIIFVISFYLINKNFYKFQSVFFEQKWKFTKEKINFKNKKTFAKQELGKISFEDNEFNFLKISLEENGISYRDDYVYRPIGYIDVFQDRIIFAAHDGSFYKIEEDKYSLTTIVLKGLINLDEEEILFEKFFDPEEIIIGSTDFSHSGGRIVKYKNNKFLLTVPDHALMDDYENFLEKMNSKDSIIGKILLINENDYKIFSLGHRNPQGLFYDKINDLVFESEHGPTGGDEINLIKEDNHYGWPTATYGAKIEGLNKFRNHEKNKFTEPLSYWWPRNCGISEILKIENEFNKDWDKFTLLNACLSGSGANQGESIYRWEYDIKKNKLTKKNQYFIGDRIRDLKYSKNNKTLLLLLEDQKTIGLIYSN